MSPAPLGEAFHRLVGYQQWLRITLNGNPLVDGRVVVVALVVQYEAGVVIVVVVVSGLDIHKKKMRFEQAIYKPPRQPSAPPRS